MIRRRLQSISGIFCVLLLVISCNDNPSSVNEEPPQVPEASTMQMDFSEFDSQQQSQKLKAQSNDNFSRAVGTAVIMKAVVEINLAIPRALLTAANNADAELNDNEKWEWNFSETAGDTSYAVRLVAERESEDEVNWNFYVTNSEVGVDDQLFFSGTTNTDGTQGVWSYYNLQNTSSQEQVSQIEWSVNGENDVDLRLEVTSDRNDHQGDYLEYAFDGTLKTAVYYDSSEEQETILQLNVNSNVGFIIAPNYNNGEQACWDGDFQDIACSEV